MHIIWKDPKRKSTCNVEIIEFTTQIRDPMESFSTYLVLRGVGAGAPKISVSST